MTDDLHDLTDAALRRHLAERLGWRVMQSDVWSADGLPAWVLTRPDMIMRLIESAATLDDAWDQALNGPEGEAIPNWPTDEGAALRACMAVARERGWYLLIEANNRHGKYYVAFGPGGLEGRRETHDLYASTLARALAELLAAALEDGR